MVLRDYDEAAYRGTILHCSHRAIIVHKMRAPVLGGILMYEAECRLCGKRGSSQPNELAARQALITKLTEEDDCGW